MYERNMIVSISSTLMMMMMGMMLRCGESFSSPANAHFALQKVALLRSAPASDPIEESTVFFVFRNLNSSSHAPRPNQPASVVVGCGKWLMSYQRSSPGTPTLYSRCTWASADCFCFAAVTEDRQTSGAPCDGEVKQGTVNRAHLVHPLESH